MRRALVALLLLPLSCAGADPLPSPKPPAIAPPAPEPVAVAKTPPEDPSAGRVRDWLAKVSQIRGLPIRHQVASRTLPRAEIIAKIRKHVDEEIPPAILVAEGESLIGFGLLPPDFDFLNGALALLEEQIAGFYEPSDQTMYMVDDLGEKEADETLAHELVHALQDQSFSIQRFLDFKLGESDRIAAAHALIEGDATSAMIDANGDSALGIDPGAMKKLLFAGTALSSVGSKTPPVMLESLVAPYADGFAFIDNRRRNGGWKAVDAAYERLPATTEQLLHPDKYAKNEPALKIPLIPVAALGPSFTVRLDDDMGEESVRIMLEAWSNADAGAKAASGWGGDRVVLAEKPGPEGASTFAVAFHLRFDGSKEADAATAVLSRKFKPCTERPDLGPFVWKRRGADLVIVGGPYERRGKVTKSAGTCADATRWITAILAAP